MYPQPHYNDILFKKLRLCCRPDSVVKCFKVHCEKVYYKVSLIKIEMCAKNASTASSQLLKGRTSCTEDKTIFYHACLWWRPCGRHPSGGQRPRFLFMSHDLWRSKESTWGWDWLLREMQCCQIGSESLQYRESWRRLCRSNARHCASFLSLAVLWRFDQDQSLSATTGTSQWDEIWVVQVQYTHLITCLHWCTVETSGCHRTNSSIVYKIKDYISKPQIMLWLLLLCNLTLHWYVITMAFLHIWYRPRAT